MGFIKCIRAPLQPSFAIFSRIGHRTKAIVLRGNARAAIELAPSLRTLTFSNTGLPAASLIVIVVSCNSICQAQQTSTTQDPSKTFLDYAKAVRDEEADYLSFIKEIAVAGVAIGAFVLTSGGVALTFFSYKSKADIKQEVSARIAKDVGEEIKSALEKSKLDMESKMGDFIQKGIAQFTEDIRQRKEFIDKMLIDLSQEIENVRNPVGRESVGGSPSTDELLQGFRILWVDDTPRNNEELAALFRSSGATVARALNTDGALRILSSNNFDLIISDMSRPEGDVAGLDLLSQMRANGINTPLIFFCGSGNLRTYGGKAIESGAYAITATFPGVIQAVTSVARHLPPPGVISS